MNNGYYLYLRDSSRPGGERPHVPRDKIRLGCLVTVFGAIIFWWGLMAAGAYLWSIFSNTT